MTKTYNTPKRTHIVKTRLDDEEHAEFMRQLNIYGMSQAEFIREAISGATIRRSGWKIPRIFMIFPSLTAVRKRRTFYLRWSAGRMYIRHWSRSRSNGPTAFHMACSMPCTHGRM